MAENIVETYNLFVDTSRGRSADSQGDNFNLNLGQANIVCDSGQYIRMTLSNFSMHKNFTDINSSNNKFKVRVTNGATLGSANGELTNRNNTTYNALSKDFATQLGATLKAAAIAAGITNANTINFVSSSEQPSSLTNITGDDSNIISFTLTSNNHGITQAICLFNEIESDSYEILGADRMNSNDTQSGIDFTFATNTIVVSCRYPAQRQTTAFVYLRCTGLPNTNIETQGLNDPSERFNTDTIDSDILAKIPVDVEYCNYDAPTLRDFFINIRQKSVASLRLRLTDRHNRPLGRAYRSSSLTATGTGTKQSTLGNLSFSAVIRLDIIQQRHILELDTPSIPQTTPSRFENLLIQPKNGRNTYGFGVGR